MSERMFFTLRYALPGYIFLLTIILINWVELFSLFSGKELAALFSALFVFIYLLSGSAIGFLISQFWYSFFNRFLFGKYGVLPEVNRILRKRYEKRLKKNIDIHKLQIFSDYIQRLDGEKEMLIYAERRWDLIHLFGSTMFALPIGLLVGLYVYLVRTRIQPNQLAQIVANNASYILPLVIFLTIIYICMFFGLRRALRENSIARLMIIKGVLQCREKLPIELNDIFPEYFETKGEPKSS